MTDAAARALVVAAKAVRKKAYAPYSHYRVGAALTSRDGTTFLGTNVENASYGLTVCAERSAIFAAAAAGHRRFDAIAIATLDGGSPCGACRQVLREFVDGRAAESFLVHLANARGGVRTTTLARLLPDGFGPENLRPRK